MSTLLDAWAEEDSGQQGNGVRLALESTPELDARKAARISQLAQSLGLPENFVIENPRKAEMEVTARKLESNRMLAGWASEDRLNLALAKDDPALADSMSLGEKIGRAWDRETDAISGSYDKGEEQRQTSQMGNRYLAAIGRGDYDEAAKIQAEDDALQKRMNPLWEQESFGLLKPGSLPSISQPLRQQAKEYPPDKPLQAQLDALFAGVNTPPMQQELDDLFSAPPYIHDVDGKAVLLRSRDENGKPVTMEQAATLFQQNGQHAGIFASPQHARQFLAQNPERQREIAANWREAPEDSWVSAIGMDSALEQLPRMLFDQIPTQALRATQGLFLGATIGAGMGAGGGSVIPGAGTAAGATGGAIAGGKAGFFSGWIAGAGESAFYAERGAFALELAREKDANGQSLSPETIAIAANAYALLAAAAESGFEAVFLSLLKPLGIGKEGLRGFMRSAVKRAAFDKSTGMALLDAGLRLGANATAEGLEEAAQQATQLFVEYVAKGSANQFQDGAFDNELLTRENAAQIGEAFKGGAAAGFWLGSGPILVSTVLDVQSGRMAQAYAQQHIDLHAQVEKTSTKQLSPEHMRSALEFSGEAMRESVMLPADALVELYQKGTDLLSPLGFTEEQATKAAAQGQDFLVPVSRMHAYLDQPQFEAAAHIMRRAPDAMNAAESARLDERVAQDAAKIVELFQDQASELEALGQEKERLRAETANAIQNTPGLKAQAESLGGGVDQYVGDWVNTLERYALRMAAAGQNPVEIFQRVSFNSLRQARRGAMSTADAIGEDLAEMQPEAAGVAATPAADVLVHNGVESIDDLYALAGQSKEGFQAGIASIAQATGGQPMFRPGDGLKGRARTEEKIRRDYQEIGAKRVLDILGGTILYDSRADVEKALPEIERLVREAGGEVVRGPVNRFEKPSAGYKDFLLNIRQPNGLITELLLTTNAMNQAKTEGAGHYLYEGMQKAEEVIKNKDSTEEQRKEAWEYFRVLKDASKAYYGSTGDQSNATASFSDIVEPLNIISAMGASNANSSLYGELESLLGNILNSPDLATTNGLSSQSTNSSTNTGELGPSDSQGVPTASRPSMNRAINGLSGISEPPSNADTIPQDGAQNKDIRKVIGSETAILLGAHGEQSARYEVRELADIIPSHDPENQFAKRTDYPGNVQERPYHSDAGEQQKVRGNALRLDPRLVVNNNPDLTNGPPAITQDGIVLGGNSRAMSVQLAYANNSERAQAYRDAIASQAARFGLDASAVAGMERPVLVRVVEAADPAEMGKLARLYNQTAMQGLQSKAEGVSKARLISQGTLDALAADMADFDSLRAFLDSASSRGFTDALLRDGVLEQTQLSRLTEKNGRLNDAGKTLVENALRGMIVPDYDILASVPSSALNKLDRVIPALARMKARGEGWDMSAVVTAALRQIANAATEGKKVDVYLAQGDLIATDPDKGRPAVQALALTFANATQKEAQARFELMARDSEKQTKGQSLLVAMPENTPAQSFTAAFLGTIASVDGQGAMSFEPQTNQIHAALEYAYNHGGKGHSVAMAMEKLQRTIGNKKATAEQKAEAREMIRQLSRFSGSVSVYQPKLGSFFRRQEGQELFQYAGQNSRMSDPVRANLAEAQRLAEAGTDNEAIRQQTGWFKGMDGKWRYEIADNPKGIKKFKKDRKGKNPEPSVHRLSEIYDNPDLYEAYPFLRDMSVAREPLSGGTLGSYDSENNIITISFLLEDPSSTLIHEIQHAIQKREDFASGGSPAGMKKVVFSEFDALLSGESEVAQLLEEHRDLSEELEDEELTAEGKKRLEEITEKLRSEYKDFFDRYLELLEKTRELNRPGVAFEMYTSLAGEIEARDASLRKDFNPRHRREIKPSLDNDSIVIFGGKQVAAMSVEEATAGAKRAKFEAAPMAVVTGEEIYGTQETLPGKTTIRDKLVGWLSERGWIKKFSNADTGWNNINVSKASVRSIVFHGAGRGKVQAIAALPDLIEHGVYLEPQDIGNGLKRHIFAAKLNIGGDPFVVGFVVQEDQQGRKYYEHELTEMENLGSLASPARWQEQTRAGRDSVMNIVRKHLGVNPDMTLNQGARGSTKIYPEGYLIGLFKNADLSTLFHETGHIFFEEMERVVQSGAADQTMIRDYDTMRAWLGAEAGVPLSTAQREQVARGFEAWLMEGKAPAEDLKGVFGRFRRWLLKIYSEAVNLDVDLTDEVRGVFDRMLATEREIAATAARNELLDLTGKELDSLGFTGAARNTATGLMPRAREAALASLQQARDQNRKQRVAKYFKEALDEVRAAPIYKARADMRKTPLDLAAIRDSFGESTAETLRKKTPGGMKYEGGIDPEIFAAEHGFDSATDMVTQLLEAPSQADAVRSLVNEKEMTHDAAYEAFEHLLDTREVSVQMEMVGRKLAELLNVDHIEREAYMRAARAELAAMPLGRAMQTGNFLAAMRRALRQERDAINAGDRAAALEGHRKAMLNMEFVRESRDIARRQESVQGRMKRFIGMAKGDPDARYIVMDIGMRHGLNKFNERLAEGRDTRTIQSWLAAAESDGYDIFPDDRVLYGPGRPWREMAVSGFDALAETIAQIVTVERGRRQITDGQKKIEFNEATDSIEQAIDATMERVDASPVGEDSELGSWFRARIGSITKIEILAAKLDGGFFGPFWRMIFKRVSDAEDARGLRAEAERKRQLALYDIYNNKEQQELAKGKMIIRALGTDGKGRSRTITRENMLAVALNLGNEGNRSRLMNGKTAWGEGVTPDALAEILSHMTQKDCKFVQAVWDYLDSFREEAFALEEKVNGLRPERVEPAPFDLALSDGSVFSFKGGYYPIAYNSKKGSGAQRTDQNKLKEDLFGEGFGVSATTRKGHLKQREDGIGEPLLFNLGVIQRHVHDVITDITMREALIDAARLIRSKKVSAAIVRAQGIEGYSLLMPWLRDVARERVPTDWGESFISWTRGGISIMGIGVKLGTGMLQISGLSAGASKLGWKWTIRGLREVYGDSIQDNPFTAANRLSNAYDWAASLSPFMAGRMKSQIREQRELNDELLRGGKVDAVRRHAYDIISYMQMYTVDLPLFTGAYSRAMSEGKGHTDAVAYAEQIVRLTQGSGRQSDLAAIQRNGEFWKLTTTFYTWFNAMFNLASLTKSEMKWARSKPEAVKIAASFLFSAWIGTQAVEIALDGIRNRWPDDDDGDGAEEEWLKYLAGKFAGFWTGMIPLLRNIRYGKQGLDFELTGLDRGMDSATATVNSIIKLVEGSGESPVKKAAVNAVRATGYITKTPTEPAAQLLEAVWNYMDGTTPELEIRKTLLR